MLVHRNVYDRYMIDLAAVRSLQAVDTEGSVVAAADALGFTPSAVSQQIKRLERQSGVPLLERVGRGVVLTWHARQLVDAGTHLLAEVERLESGLHRAADSIVGQVRLAAFSTAMRGIVAPVASRLVADHPDLTIRLVEREPWEAIDLVATGQCDVALVHRWGHVSIDVPDHVERRTVGADVADLIVHRDHRLAEREVVTPHDLVDEDWIATFDGTICRQWLVRMHDTTGRRPRIAHESMEFESHLALVAAGLGVALIPRLGRATLGADVVAVGVADPVPTRELIVVHRRSMGDSPAVRAVIDALAECAADTSG